MVLDHRRANANRFRRKVIPGNPVRHSPPVWYQRHRSSARRRL